MEQLRGLDEADPVPSPRGSLDPNTDGYSDYLEAPGDCSAAWASKRRLRTDRVHPSLVG